MRAVRANHADIGVALDGDADRLQIVDGAGRLYNGDELLYLLVKDRLDNGGVPGAVGTLMTNMAVEVALKGLGVPFVRAKVGDRYVLEQLHKHGWQLGAEGSGHILCLDKHTTGDGIVSALQVLSALKRAGQTLAQMTADISMYPQSLINVKIPAGYDWKSNTALQAEKAAVEEQLGERGRVLLRPSGTEPLIRVMVEAQEAELARSMAQRIAAKVL